MQKQVLTRANRQLYGRTADEVFSSLPELAAHCRLRQEEAQDLWVRPAALTARAESDRSLQLVAGDDGEFVLNDWSFGQLCRLAGVARETVNRLSADTAVRVLAETLPEGDKPLQLFTTAKRLRSIHGTAYTRLFDAELVGVIEEYATDFQPPQLATGGGTGLYAGEQDMFAFLIDPTGWAEIEGEAFAPGFFVWNSEVGRRSLGIQTFWFQAVCQNHLVWDAVEVVDYSRKHTASVRDALDEVRRIIETLVQRRDARRDGFQRVIRRAMQTTLGTDVEEVMKALAAHGYSRATVQEALRMAERQGRFTIFSLVDALTRMAGQLAYAGDRLLADEQAASLLALAV